MLLLGWTLGCAGIVSGDWEALSVTSERGTSVATGDLEIDLDGETELEVDMAGDGPTGSLRASGATDRDEGSLALVGDLDGRVVNVVGTCVRADRELVCELEVGDADWTFDFRRD